MSVDPPNVALHQNAEQVDQPHKGDTDKDQNDSQHDADHVVLVKAAAQAIDHPHDSNGGDAKNELNERGKIVNGIDQAFHNMLLDVCICK